MNIAIADFLVVFLFEHVKMALLIFNFIGSETNLYFCFNLKKMENYNMFSNQLIG